MIGRRIARFSVSYRLVRCHPSPRREAQNVHCPCILGHALSFCPTTIYSIFSNYSMLHFYVGVNLKEKQSIKGAKDIPINSIHNQIGPMIKPAWDSIDLIQLKKLFLRPYLINALNLNYRVEDIYCIYSESGEFILRDSKIDFTRDIDVFIVQDVAEYTQSTAQKVLENNKELQDLLKENEWDLHDLAQLSIDVFLSLFPMKLKVKAGLLYDALRK